MTQKILLLVLLVCGLGACGDDSTGPEGVTGTYTLRSVNGEPLPYVTIQSGADTSEITAGSLTLKKNLICSSSMTLRVTEGGVVTTSTNIEACTYAFEAFKAFNDGDLSVRPDGTNSINSGSITGSQLTLQLFTETGSVGLTLIFQK